MINETNHINDEIKVFLNKLDYRNYINTNTERNIKVGE